MAAINVFPEQVAVDSSTGKTITFSKGNPPPVSASWPVLCNEEQMRRTGRAPRTSAGRPCSIGQPERRSAGGDNAIAAGGRFVGGRRALQECHPGIGEVRGRGLMIGVELIAKAEGAPAPDLARASTRKMLAGT